MRSILSFAVVVLLAACQDGPTSPAAAHAGADASGAPASNSAYLGSGQRDAPEDADATQTEDSPLMGGSGG